MGFRVEENPMLSAYAMGMRIPACPNCQRRAGIDVSAEIDCIVHLDPRGRIQDVETKPFMPHAKLHDLRPRCAACGHERPLDEATITFLQESIDIDKD